MNNELLDSIKSIVRYAKEKAKEIEDDKQAYDVKMLFKDWVSGEHIEAGQYCMRNGELYRCLSAHDSQDTWEPENAPSIFAKILPGQSGTDIGEWVQPDSTNPYMKGDRVTHNGKTWESDIDNNVWEPGVYGWSEVNA